METQNISVQLFNKELPISQTAAYFGCKNDFTTDYLTTCVDYLDSDAQIENAFQKQLDLSDYYKSQQIFNSMKRQFADQTMEGMYNTSKERFPIQQLEQSGSVQPILPVGPRDTLFESIKKGNTKETFGSMLSGNSIYIIILAVLAGLIIYLMRK